MVLVSKNDTANGLEWEFGLRRQGGQKSLSLYFRGMVEGAEVFVRSQRVITVGNVVDDMPTAFINVAMSWNRGVVTFYKNGAVVTSRTVGIAGSSLLPDTGASLYIGAEEGTTNGIDAIIDEVRISQTLRYPDTAATDEFTAD